MCLLRGIADGTAACACYGELRTAHRRVPATGNCGRHIGVCLLQGNCGRHIGVCLLRGIADGTSACACYGELRTAHRRVPATGNCGRHIGVCLLRGIADGTSACACYLVVMSQPVEVVQALAHDLGKNRRI